MWCCKKNKKYEIQAKSAEISSTSSKSTVQPSSETTTPPQETPKTENKSEGLTSDAQSSEPTKIEESKSGDTVM